MKQLLILFAAVALTTGCKQLDDVPGTYDISMVNNDNYKAYGMTLTIEMGDENKISGHSGCNSFFGSFKNPESNKVEMGSIGASKMYCAQKNEVERNYLDHLSKVKSVKPTKTGLELMDASGKIIITAIKK